MANWTYITSSPANRYFRSILTIRGCSVGRPFGAVEGPATAEAWKSAHSASRALKPYKDYVRTDMFN
jgi:hypothetical protein